MPFAEPDELVPAIVAKLSPSKEYIVLESEKYNLVPEKAIAPTVRIGGEALIGKA